MIEFSQYQTTPAIPEASSMIETFRAIGYNIETAVADIIDNSISATAKNIWVSFEWKGGDTWVSIKDDGVGMNNEELIQAMRPGSRNPLDNRSIKDLGRFGLGLKTASFSQCRKLTVLSRKENNENVYWTWDLDFVNQTGKWDLIKYLPKGDFENQLSQQNSGTIVIWNDLDRVVKSLREEDSKALNKFLQIMDQVKRHLSMVFHRFIDSGRVKIHFQDRIIQAWDPFLVSESATQAFPEDPIQNGLVSVKGYVLPHKSKLTGEKFREAEGPKGWNEQQGFYIYRNERLLLGGDWLGMFRKEEHYKLARIEINLPNSLDAEWQIDIKKAVARPPISLRDQLKAYAGKVRMQAVEVYRHKGKVLQRKFAFTEFQPVWLEKIRHGKRFYEINREHPLIRSLFDKLNENSNEIKKLLRFVEETVPVPLITIQESENPEMQGQPFENTDHEPVKTAMEQMFKKMVSSGMEHQHAISIILNIEPFNHFPHFSEHLK